MGKGRCCDGHLSRMGDQGHRVCQLQLCLWLRLPVQRAAGQGILRGGRGVSNSCGVATLHTPEGNAAAAKGLVRAAARHGAAAALCTVVSITQDRHVARCPAKTASVFGRKVTLRLSFRQADGFSRGPSLDKDSDNQEWREIDRDSQQCVLRRHPTGLRARSLTSCRGCRRGVPTPSCSPDRTSRRAAPDWRSPTRLCCWRCRRVPGIRVSSRAISSPSARRCAVAAHR